MCGNPPKKQLKLFHALFQFFSDMIYLFCEISDTMPFQHQCLYWHNYFRTLHQVSLQYERGTLLHVHQYINEKIAVIIIDGTCPQLAIL